MWTCNEEALYDTSPVVDDGPLSTASAGSVVRLQRFVRSSVHGAWTANGQWAYLTESFGANSSFTTAERSGVSDLCVLPDGTLLVLERTLGYSAFIPHFENRIYRIDFSGATDVSAITSLNGASYTRVTKTQLWSGNFSTTYNFEGLCLGPRLVGDALSLLTIADGDGDQDNALYALKLSGLSTRQLSVATPFGVAEPVGGPYRHVVGATLTNSVASPLAQGTTQYVCTGWALTGGDPPASGSGHTMTMTIGNDGSLTWLWATNYWLEAESVGHGTVAPGDGWHRAGTNVTLIATPASGYRFDYWTGDVPPAWIGCATNVLTVSGPLRVTAHFRSQAPRGSLFTFK
jgi:hypothetical protein